jgi:hypothetical protein
VVPGEPVRILVTDKDDPWDTGAKVFLDTGEPAGVYEGDVVEAVAANGGENTLRSDTFVYVFDSAGLLAQSLKIHTSCSQPLSLGDRFGSLMVFGMEREDEGGVSLGQEVLYTYDVKNEAAVEVFGVEVSDSFGTVEGSPIPSIPPGETVTLSRQVVLLTAHTNVVTAMEGTGACEAQDTVIVEAVEPEEPCGECEGKVTELTLEYSGPEAEVTVYEGKDARVDRMLFTALLGPGDIFTFTGIRDDLTMSSEISLWIDGERYTKVHTSCSQPIGPGMVIGYFEILEGYSKDGGKLCPLPDCGECDGKVTQLTLAYSGAPAQVTVYEGDDAKADKVLFDEWLEPGDAFTFTGIRDDLTMSSEISLWVNGVLHVEVHTSCSQPIAPGMVFGDFEILEGYSKDGGKLCPP